MHQIIFFIPAKANMNVYKDALMPFFLQALEITTPETKYALLDLVKIK